MRVSTPEALNYIHVILNLYIKLGEFAVFRNEAILLKAVALVTKLRSQPIVYGDVIQVISLL